MFRCAVLTTALSPAVRHQPLLLASGEEGGEEVAAVAVVVVVVVAARADAEKRESLQPAPARSSQQWQRPVAELQKPPAGSHAPHARPRHARPLSGHSRRPEAKRAGAAAPRSSVVPLGQARRTAGASLAAPGSTTDRRPWASQAAEKHMALVEVHCGAGAPLSPAAAATQSVGGADVALPLAAADVDEAAAAAAMLKQRSDGDVPLAPSRCASAAVAESSSGWPPFVVAAPAAPPLASPAVVGRH